MHNPKFKGLLIGPSRRRPSPPSGLRRQWSCVHTHVGHAAHQPPHHPPLRAHGRHALRRAPSLRARPSDSAHARADTRIPLPPDLQIAIDLAFKPVADQWTCATLEYHQQHVGGAAPANAPPPPPSGGPLHWGYSPSASWPQEHQQTHHQQLHQQRPASKRALSESDDCDDVFSEESGKEQCTSPGEPGTCSMMTRKKRRGVIEKKRRDRINSSLTELKRLVPSALEKQGSAKLEKAEILQLTVDHLKMLHAKGVDSFAYDPQRYAMDYHSIGFRECASEVARYLVSCEGLDIQDPLRLRLMSHLQCFAAQRELASKSCSSPYPHSYPSYPQVPSTQPYSHAHAPMSAPPAPHAPIDHHHGYSEGSVSSIPPPAPPLPATSTANYPPSTYHHSAPAPPHHQYSQSGSKPYRPWGAELAY